VLFFVIPGATRTKRSPAVVGGQEMSPNPAHWSFGAQPWLSHKSYSCSWAVKTVSTIPPLASPILFPAENPNNGRPGSVLRFSAAKLVISVRTVNAETT
jgi:hypothetical protein